MTGETTVPTSRTTRWSIVSPSKSSSALDVPILVEFPPHNTMPPTLANACRWEVSSMTLARVQR
jgi:hypothetical protein